MLQKSKLIRLIEKGTQINLRCVAIVLTIVATSLSHSLYGQQVSPLQTGHYSGAFSHVRDMAKGAPGLAIVLYNQYSFTNSYVDKNGDRFDRIPLGDNTNLDVNLKSFVTVPSIFYGMPFTILGGAQWMVGITPSYMWSDGFFRIEQRGGVQDEVLSESFSSKLNGFADLSVTPLGLTWGFDHFDLTFYYGFTAPTGRYESGADDNIGLGLWTHTPQLFTYYYPKVDQSTAMMVGLTYELNGKVRGEEFNPGNRLTLEWGFSQYVSDRLELGVLGGHNWQVTDDKGDDVWWDANVYDRKSTVAFTAGYWAWQERLQVNFKYGFDFGMRQRFKTDMFMLNLVFVTNALTGS
jgi:hypothetical protein